MATRRTFPIIPAWQSWSVVFVVIAVVVLLGLLLVSTQ
jgi:hypothetical protein